MMWQSSLPVVCTMAACPTFVEPRIVDQTLPADGRARLLEVHAHHDDQLIGELALETREPLCVVDGRGIIVNRAGTHDDDQTIVRAVQHAMDRLTRAEDGFRN